MLQKHIPAQFDRLKFSDRVNFSGEINLGTGILGAPSDILLSILFLRDKVRVELQRKQKNLKA